MSKKAAIATLVTFWIIVIGLRVIEAINGRLLSLYIILTLWAFVTSIVVFIGMLVVRQRNTSSADVKQATIHPVITLSICTFLYSGLFFIYQPLIYFNIIGMEVFYVLNIFAFLIPIAFPVIWLVTWAHNGDITLACIKKKNYVRPLLLELN